MPSSAGPNTAGESNLVFAYDTGDTLNSYKGEPTINYVVDPTHIGYSGGEFMQYTDLAPIFNTYGSSSLYSLSLDLKSQNTANQNQILVYMQNGSTTKYAFVSQWVTATTEYQRFKFEGLTPSISNPADTAATLAFYGIYGTGNNPYVKNVQVEIKPHCTPFVNGTRSVTQGLVPLASNYAIDLTNASYNSNAQISLDGSNDYIKVAQNANFYTNSWAWEMVVKFTSTIGTYQGLVWAEGATGAGSGYQYLLSLVSNSYFHYRINNTVTGWANTDTSSITFDPLKYNHIVWQFVNGITSIYVNGNLFHTDSTRGAYNGGTDSPLFIGARNDGALAAPIMPILYKFYNVPLIQSQITQNYLAYKTRFNLA